MREIIVERLIGYDHEFYVYVSLFGDDHNGSAPRHAFLEGKTELYWYIDKVRKEFNITAPVKYIRREE